MKANAPEKIYVQLPSRKWIGRTWNETPIKEGDNPNWKNATNIEYTRTDAFIEKALKWYCLDCECNDNCKDTKCYFYRQYERYLKGEKNAIPPKFSDVILNEDGSTSDDWRYRHFIAKIQDAFIANTIKRLIIMGIYRKLQMNLYQLPLSFR